MNRLTLTAETARRGKMSRAVAADAVDAVLATIADALANGERVTISGFGTFEVRCRKERMARNPKTKEQMVLPAVRLPAFRPAPALCRQLENRSEEN